MPRSVETESEIGNKSSFSHTIYIRYDFSTSQSCFKFQYINNGREQKTEISYTCVHTTHTLTRKRVKLKGGSQPSTTI